MGTISVLMLAISARAGGFQQSVETSNSLLTQGLSLIRSGDFQGAAEKLRESIRANPASAAAHYNLALALVRLEKNSDAIEELQKVTALAPQIAPAHYNLALLLEESGRLPDAIDQLRAFCDLNPGDPAGVVHLIGDYFKTGDSTNALSVAREALAQSPEMKVQAQVGMLLVQNGHGSEALQPLENVLRSAPDAVAVMPYLGRAYLETGQAEKAIAVLRQALKLSRDGNPASVTLNLLLGVRKQIFMAQGRQGLTSTRHFGSTRNLRSVTMYREIYFCASETTKRPRRATKRPRNSLRRTISTRMMSHSPWNE